LRRQRRGGHRQVRSGLDDVHRVTDRRGPARFDGRGQCVAIRVVGHPC